MKRGVFVVFEGIDRVGKSTQATKLVDYLKSESISVEYMRFPDRSSPVTGKVIDEYLQNKNQLNDQTIHLLFSANRWENANKIETLLKNKTHVICDRYAYSGIAYSVAKGLDLNWCQGCDIGLPKPDFVIQLDMDVEKAAHRGNFGTERYEKVDFQKSVQTAFSKLFEEKTWGLVNADHNEEKLHRKIKKLFIGTMILDENEPIKYI